MDKPCAHCNGRGTISTENIIGDPTWEPCPTCKPSNWDPVGGRPINPDPTKGPWSDPTQDPPEGMDGDCSMCGLPVIEARTLLEARRAALSKEPPHQHEPITEADITEEDRALVADFYRDACHAEWCEFDHDMLLYMVVRSRLNGRRSVETHDENGISYKVKSRVFDLVKGEAERKAAAKESDK